MDGDLVFGMSILTLVASAIAYSLGRQQEFRQQHDAYYEERAKNADACEVFRHAHDAFLKEFGPSSVMLIFSDHIFVSWRHGDHCIDVKLQMGRKQEVVATRRLDMCGQDFPITNAEDDLAFVLRVFRPWAEKYGLLPTKEKR